MSRRSVEITAWAPKHDRQAVWEVIRTLKDFTAPDIRAELPGAAPLDRIREYCGCLVAGGYLTKTGPRYRLVKDLGAEAPRLRRDGTEVTQGQQRERIWRAMRVLKRFTVAELMLASADGDKTPAQAELVDYCRWLSRAGILIHRPNTLGMLTEYLLLPSKVPGPLPPQILRRKALWDPNHKRILYQQGQASGGDLHG